jgi:hypothetical protein
MPVIAEKSGLSTAGQWPGTGRTGLSARNSPILGGVGGIIREIRVWTIEI